MANKVDSAKPDVDQAEQEVDERKGSAADSNANNAGGETTGEWQVMPNGGENDSRNTESNDSRKQDEERLNPYRNPGDVNQGMA